MSFIHRLQMALRVLFNIEQLSTPQNIPAPHKSKTFLNNREIIEQATLNNMAPATIHRNEFIFDKLNFGNFPENPKSKPKNQLFFKVKEQLVKEAFEALDEYYQFVIHLAPISRDKFLSNALWHMITRMIAVYWDMPASAYHHDRDRFGLLKHAIITATNEARRISCTNYYKQNMGLDDERTRKNRGKLVVCAFFIGLVHDADKLLQMRLTYRAKSGLRVFSPVELSGKVLDFKLAYPADKMTLTWLERSTASNLKLGLHYFYLDIFPSEFLKTLDGTLLEFMFACIKNYKSEADHIAVNFTQTENEYINEIRIALTKVFKDVNNLNVHEAIIFKMNENWYMAIQGKFIAALNRELLTAENTIEHTLIDSGFMFKYGDDKRPNTTVSLNVKFESDRNFTQYNVSFYQASLLETLPTLKDKVIEPSSIKIAASHIEYLTNIGIKLPLTCFIGQTDSRKNFANVKEIQKKDEPTAIEEINPDATSFANKKKEQESPHHSLDANSPPVDVYENDEYSYTQSEEWTQDGNVGGQNEVANNPQPNGIEKTHQPSSRKELEQIALNKNADKPDTPLISEYPFLAPDKMKALRSLFTEEFIQAIPLMKAALLESIANALGANVANSRTVPHAHFQMGCNNNTIFYLAENRKIYARTPQVLKFAWGVMMHQQETEKLNDWISKISDMPVAFNGNDNSSNILAYYFYNSWVKDGFLIPDSNQPTFKLNSHLMPILSKKGSGNSFSSNMEKIDGTFIAFDSLLLDSCVTSRLGRRRLEQVFRYYYKIMYDKEWD